MSLSPYPSFAYSIPAEGAKLQAVHGSERPGAAMVSAFASHLRGQRILGTGRNLSEDQILGVFKSAASLIGIPWERMILWADGINDTKLPASDLLHVQGLKPSPYQRGAAARVTVAGGTLAMGVGLGKTLTSMLVADSVAKVSHARCWIICPLAAFPAWAGYKDWLLTRFVDVQIVSVDSAHKLVGADMAAGGLLIVDEAHYAGHHAARRTKALHKLRLAFDVCLCLTGTLLHSGIEAAMNVLDLAIPGSTGFSTKWTAGEYFRCIERKQLGARTVAQVVKPAGQERDRFIAWVSRYVVSLDKASPEVRNDITIPDQHLSTINLDGDDAADEDTAIDCLVRLAREVLAETGDIPHASALAHRALREGAAGKLDWLHEQMQDNDEPVAVFAEYHETLDLAVEFFTENDISFVRVDGSVTGDDRAEAVRKFQAGEARIFLGQMDATGLSINLFRAAISVAIDLGQRATNYAQMLGRTCRRGQTSECHHFDLAANAIQRTCIGRLRAGEDFSRSLTTYQAAIAAATKKG